MQSIFRDFTAHYTTSVKADLDQAQLMEYITTIYLGESGLWKGSYYFFIFTLPGQILQAC